jgi:hypothetical protein
MSKPRIRQRIERCIYVDQYGVAVCVKRNGQQVEKRFPPGTPLDRLIRYRDKLRSRRQVKRTAWAAALNRDPYLFGHKQCFVYFVRDGDTVKIGRAVDVSRRINSLRTANARDLVLMGSVLATDHDERALHAQFAHLRIDRNREWFRLTDELQRFIESLPSPP